MTTETMANELHPQHSFDHYVPPSGLWEIMRSFLQAFRAAVDLSEKLQSLPVEEQADFARRFFDEQVP